MTKVHLHVLRVTLRRKSPVKNACSVPNVGRSMTVLRRNQQPEGVDASSRAQRRMARVNGMYLSPRPEGDYPKVPLDVSELHDVPLMKLFTQLTLWSEYTNAQLACAEIDERHAETEMEKQKALASLGDSKTVTAAKARAYESEEFLAARKWHQEAHAYRKLVQVMYDNTDRFASLLSRELTRRVNREPREGRERGWTT